MSASEAAAVDGTADEDIDVDDAVDEFLYEEKQIERKDAVDKILKAFKLNPLEILGMPHNATPTDVKKQYRSLSLLVHPDKCKLEFRDRAQKAFAMLAQAKADVEDDVKREQFNEFVSEAKQKVNIKCVEAWKKKMKAEINNAKKQAEVNLEAYAEKPLPNPPEFSQTDELYDEKVMKEIKEIIIEREWKKRQLLKQAQKEDVKAAEAAQAATVEAQKKNEEVKDWEEGRGQRIETWRAFVGQPKQVGKKRKIGFLRMPKLRAEDEERTFVRRPAVKRG